MAQFLKRERERERERVLRFQAECVAMTSTRPRNHASPQSPPDRLPPRRCGGSSPSPYTYASAARRGLVRSARALATAALLALSGALFLPDRAQAQAIVLVSNIGQTDDGGASLDDSGSLGQAFSVGAGGGDYTLTSIEIPIEDNGIAAADIDSLSVSVWSTNSSGLPSSLLHPLRNPSSIAADTTATFNAQAGATLEAGKTYAVVVYYDKTLISGWPAWVLAGTGDDDSPATGWEIADSSLYRGATATNWSSFADEAYKIRVNGSAAGGTPTCTLNTGDLWCGVVTVGAISSGGSVAAHGFAGTDGGLDDKTFSVGTNNYTIDGLYVGTAGDLNLDLTGALDAADKGNLKLVVGSTDFDLDDATHVSSENAYLWTGTGLDWSSDTHVTLRMRRAVALSTDATLSGLTVYDGSSNLTLSPTFASGTETYTASAAYDIATVTVTATKNQADATIAWLDASDATLADADAMAPGRQVALEAGANTFKVKVTAEDGTTTKTYTVTVNRATPSCTLNTGDLWCGVVTVGSFVIPSGTVHGYVGSIGDLSDTTFSVGSNNYTITVINHSADGTLIFDLSSDLTAADRAKLVLHHGGAEFEFSAASITFGNYQWTSAGLDWSSESFVTLRLRDTPVANNAPVFSPTTATREVEENSAAGTNVGAVIPEATDSDSGDTLTYSMEGTDAASFAFDASTRQITTITGVTYNYEATKNSYSVTVKASDGTASATIAVTIDVTDVNEKSAKPDKPTLAAVTGSSTSLTATWTKPDLNGGPDIAGYDLQYRVGTTGTWEDFAHSDTAVTTTVTGLTADTSYQVQVRAVNEEAFSDWSDASDAVKTNAEMTTTCALNPGDLWCGVVTVEELVFEGTSFAYGFVDASASPNPSDTGALSDKEFTVGTNRYTIDIATVGLGATAEGLNFSLTSALSDTDKEKLVLHVGSRTFAFSDATRTNDGFTYQWSNTGLDWSSETSVTLRLRGAPNNAPAFSPTSTTRTVEENSTAGTNVGAVIPEAMDADSGDTLTYSMEGTDAASFAFDASARQITTIAGVDYNFEATQNTYEVTVKASDGTDSGELAVTISLTDADEKSATPAKPTLAKVAGSSTSLTATWTKPDLDGGPDIAGYDLQYRVGTTGTWEDFAHSDTAVTTTVTGLTADTSYQVRVRAKNGETDSDWSDPSDAVHTNAVDIPIPPGLEVTLHLSHDEPLENAGWITVTATASPASPVPFTVTVSADPVAPATEDDFRLSSNRVLSFAANATESTGTVRIQPVNDDDPEPPDVVTVSGAVSNAAIRDPDNVTLTIINDDPDFPQDIAIDAPAAVDEDAGTAVVTVTLTTRRNTAPVIDVGLYYYWRPETATRGEDYTPPPGEVFGSNVLFATVPTSAFSPNAAGTAWEAERTFAIGIVNDREAEGDETIVFRVQSSADESPTHTITLRDDDTPAMRNVTLVGGPGSDREWSRGERVELEVRYSLPVEVERPECWSYNDDGTCKPPGPFVVVSFRSDARPGYGRVLSTPLAPYVGGSGTRVLRFAYTVGAAEDGARGVWAADDGILLRGATIRPLGGGDAELSEYTNTRVMQVAVQGSGRAWTAGEKVRVRVRFTGPPQPYAPDTPLDERLNWDKVDVAGGTPTIDLLLGDRERRTLARTASYVGGSGTNTLAFEYEVTAGDGRVGAVEVEAKSLASNGATIRNERGYDAELDHLGAVRYAQRPSLSVADAEATEGENATLDFVVKLDGVPGEADVTVAYRTKDVTAEAGSDYTETRGTLRFARGEGEYEKTVPVRIRDDAEEDDGETFTLLLSNVSGAGVANDDYEAVGTIRNDDAQESESESEPDPPREPESEPPPPPPPPPRVSVADARVREAAGATLDFEVTLSAPAPGPVTVDYRTVDASAKAGADYAARQGTLTFRAGETMKTVSVTVLDDAHDEGEEKMGLVLYRAAGAIRADYLAVGTIENSDPLQRAWLARFGRMAALQVIDHVAERLDARRDPGFRGRFAGRELRRGMGRDLAESFLRRLGVASAPGPIGGMAAPIGGMAAPIGGGSNPLAAGSGPNGGLDWGRLLRMGLGGGDVMTGSDFALDRETGLGGIVSVWSRGSMSRFTGREGALSFGGDVRTTMFGADYAQGPLVAGLMLSHSRGLGEYAGVDAGLLRSSVTGLYPWLGYRATNRISVWAVTGYGTGGLLLTPEGVAPLRSGLSMAMVASGARGALAGVAGGGTGFGLSFKADALWVGTSIEGVDGPDGRLAAASSSVTRVRTALEGSGGFTFGGGLSLKPSVEVGLRHDGGDADAGSGLDMGGGLVVADASTGLVVDVRARTLIAHEAEGFSERGVSVQFSWNPSPSTPLGFTARVAPSWGVQATGGAEALWGRETMAGVGARGGPAPGNRLDAEMGYGLPLGGRFVGTPRVGVRTSAAGRDYRLGYSLGVLGGGVLNLSLGVDAHRRESPARGAAEHGVAGRIGVRW